MPGDMFTEVDPFSQVFQALWDLAEASTTIMSLTKPGNRIKFSSLDSTSRDPVKTAVQDGDLPELILTSVGSQDMNMHSDSCSTRLMRRFDWLLSTGEYRITYRLYPVQWALFAAMQDYPSVLLPLTWNGAQFVKKMRWGSLSEGLSNAALNRGIKGWTSLLSVEIDMWFAKNDLRTFNAGPQEGP